MRKPRDFPLDLSRATVRTVNRAVLGAATGPAPAPQAAVTEPGRYVFTVENFRPPSLNQLMRGKLRDRMRLGREARHAIARAFLASGCPRATGKRRVSLLVTLGPRQRPCDCDSPWKATLDSCVACGALRGDSVRWCAIGDLSFRRGDAPATTIILENLP